MQNNTPGNPPIKNTRYTCTEYREEMVLLALQRKLQNPALNREEKETLRKEIAELEIRIGF
jgi:hypothetical protein